MPRALKKTVKGAKSARTVKAKTARRVIKQWTKEDVRALKAHSKTRTPVTKVSKVMKRTVGALRRGGLGEAPRGSGKGCAARIAGSIAACDNHQRTVWQRSL
jgi:hypothetical protein